MNSWSPGTVTTRLDDFDDLLRDLVDRLMFPVPQHGPPSVARELIGVQVTIPVAFNLL